MSTSFRRQASISSPRIEENTVKTCLASSPDAPGNMVFHDAKVLLGREGVNQTQTPLRLVGYTVEDKSYWIATSRFDLSAEQIALIYKLRRQIETFFAQGSGTSRCITSFHEAAMAS